MAHQPKAYKKFVATAATATLVATAIVPAASAATSFKDVNKNYEAAVNYLVANNIAQGISDTEFGTNNSIKRGDAAVMIANALGLDTVNAPASSFTDLNNRVKGAVNALNKAGIINGKSDTQFAPDQNITRAEMAKVIALAYGFDGEGVKNEFTDVNNTWDQYVDALVKYDVTLGITEKLFGATQDVKRGQFALFIHRAENAKLTEFSYEGEKTINLAYGAEFTVPEVKATVKGEEVKVTRVITDAAGKEVEKLDTKVSGKYTITYTAENGDKLVLTVNVAESTAPEVVSVSATNLKTVAVNFNQAVNEDTVDFNTVKVSKGTTTYTDTELNYVLSEDGKTLYVVFDTVSNLQSEEIKVVAEGLENTDGVEFPKAEIKATFLDTTLPVVEDVKVVNPKIVEIHTSEPIQLSSANFTNLANVKVDGVNSIAKVTADHANNVYTVEFNNALSAGQHTIAVADVKDFANFKAATKEFTITVVEDVTAPTVVSGKVVNKNTVEVKFSEPLAVSGSNAVGTFKVNGKTYSATVKSGTVDTIVIDNLNPALDLAALVEVNFEYVGVQDVLGNTVKTTQTYKFQAQDDTVAPTATASLLSTVGNLNNLQVVFSKPVNTTAGTVELRDKDNKVVATLSATDATWSKENTVATFTAAKLNLNDVNPGTYTVKIKDFVDTTLRANKIGETTLTVNAVDTKAPSVNSNYTVVREESATVNPRVRVSFSEAMDTATLQNLANFHLGTVSGDPAVFSGSRLDQLSGASVVEVAGDKKSVVLELPRASYDESANATSVIRVEGARDVAGNLVTTTNVTSAKKLAAPAVTSIVATGENTIVVTFDREIATADPSVFAVQDAADNPVTNISNAVISADDAKKVTLTTVQKLRHDVAGLELDIVGSTNKLVDVYGIAFATSDLDNPITDGIRPVASVDDDTAGKLLVEFSELVEAASFAALESDLIIRDADGNIIDLVPAGEQGNTQNVTFVAGTGAGTVDSFDSIVVDLTPGTYTVELISRNVKDDGKTNRVTPLPATTVTIVAP